MWKRGRGNRPGQRAVWKRSSGAGQCERGGGVREAAGVGLPAVLTSTVSERGSLASFCR